MDAQPPSGLGLHGSQRPLTVGCGASTMTTTDGRTSPARVPDSAGVPALLVPTGRPESVPCRPDQTVTAAASGTARLGPSAGLSSQRRCRRSHFLPPYPVCSPKAARTVFDTSGVDAPAKEITDLAGVGVGVGVGVGTLYRHFPAALGPGQGRGEERDRRRRRGGPRAGCRVRAGGGTHAVDRPVHRDARHQTRTRLRTALGGPGVSRAARLLLGAARPALSALLDAAVAEGAIRGDIGAEHLLYAVAQLCQPLPGRGPEHSRRIVGVLVDGLRCEAHRGGGEEITGCEEIRGTADFPCGAPSGRRPGR